MVTRVSFHRPAFVYVAPSLQMGRQRISLHADQYNEVQLRRMRIIGVPPSGAVGQ